jgi:MFS family permease
LTAKYVFSIYFCRYGCRKVTIVGAILAATGFLLSSITPNLEMLYITFGLISGFGLSLCYVAAVVIVAYYFDQRRSFATGISVCGSGVGTFLFAPLTQYLVDEYNGWRGASVILAGFFLNMVICGALYRDLEWTKTLRVNKKSKAKSKSCSTDQRGSSSSCSSPSRTSMPEIDQLRTILESGDISELFSQDELRECPRLSSSLVNLPTYLHCDEPLPEEVMHALGRNKAAQKLIQKHFPNSYLSRSLKENDNKLAVHHDSADQIQDKSLEHDHEPNVTKLKRKVSSLFKTKPLKPILKKPRRNTPEDNDMAEEEQEKMLKLPQSVRLQIEADCSTTTEKPPNFYLNNLRVRKQSLTYRGAMLSIPKYRLRASSCPDIYRNSMMTIPTGIEVEDETGCQKFTSLFNFCLVWKQFMNPTYIIFALSNFILYAWYDVMYVYLYNYAEINLKYDSTDATFLLSMIGILNTFGEVGIGWLGDQPWMNLNILYAVCMFFCGAATAMVPFLTNYSALATMAGIYGLCISANYSLTSPILVNLVSIEQFSNAYGLLLLVQGISNLVGPPFAGFLYDQFKIWHYTFGLGGIFIVISGLLMLILPCFRQAKILHHQRKQQRRASSLKVQSSAIIIIDSSLTPNGTSNNEVA